MDRIWNGYRRTPNKGTVGLFAMLRMPVLALARRMYGAENVAAVRFGRTKETAYLVVELRKEPEGAEGPAADAFLALSANFYEVLRDGQAGEAALFGGDASAAAAKDAAAAAGESSSGSESKSEDGDSAKMPRRRRRRRLPPRLVKRDGLRGVRLVDLFEVQVNHPISGRLLVGPLEKQRRFMGM
jgi:hypothetical protein